MAPDASFMFPINERVLCYHMGLIYEAKVLKAENYTEANSTTGVLGPHYFVHYKGWKATWDEWVDAARVLQYNDENLQTQKKLAHERAPAPSTKSKSHSKGDSHRAGGGFGGAGVGGGAGASSKGARDTRAGESTRKRKREDDDGQRKPDLRLDIPDLLKVVLVDDWEYVTKNHMLVPLPRNPTVQDVLKEFEQHILEMQTPLKHAQAIIHTLIAGLQTYFDRALGSLLLYRFERAQYADMRKQFVTGQHVEAGSNRTMSSIYGAEHLARLLVKLPEMVACTTMDDASVLLLREYVTELMRWMCERKEKLFLSEYQTPSISYTNIART
ncbi:MRG-domain-containing protein [Clavulina sp. PMI_390]|nr:MRG-domain-containing protein [Clavulina sp. PMI_390]